MSDSDYEVPLKELSQKCVGIYYLDNDPKYSEDWQIVFDADGTNARRDVVHHYITFETDEELFAFMKEAFIDIKIVGLTWESEPFNIGNKRVGTEEQEGSDERIRNLFKRENHLQQLRNEYEADPKSDKEEIEATIAVLKELPDDEYQIYADAMVEEMKSDFFTLLTEQEAQEKFITYLMMDSGKEFEIQAQHIEECAMTNRYFKGIQFNP